MIFSEKLRDLRKHFGMSQEQLAEKLIVSRQAITKWETGGGIPDVENLIAIAALFNLSLDDLLSEEKSTLTMPDFSYESVTEYDMEAEKHYDIHIGAAYEVVLTGKPGEKLRVRLASNVLESLESNFKVKIEELKNRMDVDVKSVNGISAARSKEALSVFIGIPTKFLKDVELEAMTNILRVRDMPTETLEFDGKASLVFLTGSRGNLSLNCSSDMEIFSDGLNGNIEINQISATSIIHIPARTDYFAKNKGRGNNIRFTADSKPADSSSNEDSQYIIELNGMNSELVINEYTGKQEKGSE